LDEIRFRAFRGTKRSSVYREHVVSAATLARIRDVAAREGLPLLASVEPGDLDKSEARQLAEEATSVRAEATLLELDADLTAIAEVANWCAHARRGSWLSIGASADDAG
jgi:hypothetical protein